MDAVPLTSIEKSSVGGGATLAVGGWLSFQVRSFLAGFCCVQIGIIPSQFDRGLGGVTGFNCQEAGPCRKSTLAGSPG